MTEDQRLPEPEAWDSDPTDDGPLGAPPDPDGIPNLEEPVLPYDEDEVPLDTPGGLDDLPATDDLVEDESNMDHNLPNNEGMPD